MSPGDIVLVTFPGTGGGASKLRPALLLAELPGRHQDVLVCGISTQLHEFQAQWDELIDANAPDFASSGLRHDSIVRLSYLHASDRNDIAGPIGSISAERLERLQQRLSDHLHP